MIARFIRQMVHSEAFLFEITRHIIAYRPNEALSGIDLSIMAVYFKQRVEIFECCVDFRLWLIEIARDDVMVKLVFFIQKIQNPFLLFVESSFMFGDDLQSAYQNIL